MQYYIKAKGENQAKDKKGSNMCIRAFKREDKDINNHDFYIGIIEKYFFRNWITLIK